MLGLDLVVVGDALRLEKDGVILPTDAERADAEIKAAETRALEAARVAITDLAEAYGGPIDEQRRMWISTATLEELGEVRLGLKRDRGWPR